jgi:hypothetical protein
MPEEAVKSLPLSGEEIESPITDDIGALHRMGVHAFFLNHLGRYNLFGFTGDNYLERIRNGMGYDPRFDQGEMPVQDVPEEK